VELSEQQRQTLSWAPYDVACSSPRPVPRLDALGLEAALIRHFDEVSAVRVGQAGRQGSMTFALHRGDPFVVGPQLLVWLTQHGPDWVVVPWLVAGCDPYATALGKSRRCRFVSRRTL
jgi:hypothetical protein